MDDRILAALGGEGAGHRLASRFYGLVEHDHVLRPVYSVKPLANFKCPIRNLAAYLTQLGGGGNPYSRQRWSLSLREAHQRFRIGRQHQLAWLRNMRQAMEELGAAEPARSALERFFERASAWLVNHPDGTADEAALGYEFDADPSSDPIIRKISKRWESFRFLEQTVSAIRGRDGGRALALAEGPVLREYFEEDPGAYLSLLAMLTAAGGMMADYAGEQLKARPELARQRYAFDRTLLHETARDGCVAMVELLLDLGADPNSQDEYGHPPLYFAGNAMSDANGGAVVHALVKGGADVNLQDSIKRCTALHMAARRGNVRVAKALLECGADIEVRDRAGDTPLRRAVNCRKREIVALLMAHGADPQQLPASGKRTQS